MGKELLSAASKASETEIDEEKATGTGKRSWNAICNALVETTQASLIPNMSPFTSSEHPEYLDLMSRFSHRDTSPVHHLFVPAVTPQVRTESVMCHYFLCGLTVTAGPTSGVRTLSGQSAGGDS